MSDPTSDPTSEPQDYRMLATGVADMARELLDQATVQATLNSVVAHAVKLVNGCEAPGIMVVSGGGGCRPWPRPMTWHGCPIRPRAR